MAILTDLYIANENEAEKLALPDDASAKFTRLDLKGIGMVNIATLYSIISQRPFEESMDSLEMIFQAAEEGPWIFKIPDDFVDRLVALKGKDTSAIVTQWGETEEMEGGGNKDIIAAKVNAIVNLGFTAREQGKGLLMWMSL